MTLSFLLPPMAEGCPLWNPQRDGERGMVKRPVYLHGLLGIDGREVNRKEPYRGQRIDAEMGERLALWASACPSKPAPPQVWPSEIPGIEAIKSLYDNAQTVDDFRAANNLAKEAHRYMSKKQADVVRKAATSAKERVG